MADRLAEPLMKRHDEAALRSLGSRIDDVMAGWRFAVESRDAGLASGYIHSLKTYFAARGLYTEGQSVFLEAAERLDGGGDLRALRGFALSYASWFRCHSTYDRETTSLAERSVAVLRKAGDPWALALALNHLGNLHYVSGRYDESREALEESLRIREEIGDRWGETCSLNNLGNLACECDDLEGAERIYRRCAALFEEMGDHHGVSVALANLGATAQLRGDLEESMRYLERAYAIEEERGARFGMALVRAGMAEVLVAMGRPAEAVGMFEESGEDFAELGNRWGEVRSLLGLAEAAVAMGEKGRALELLRRCVGSSEGQGWGPLRNQMAQACAELLEAVGLGGRAAELAVLVLDDGSTSKRVRIRASGLLERLDAAVRAGRSRGVEQEMAEALDELDGKV
jgi:tetratricopeptide (TPR) repeat protein